MFPVRLSGSMADFFKAFPILVTVGKSLSWGLLLCRISEAVK
jgi:hypothetical protein